MLQKFQKLIFIKIYLEIAKVFDAFMVCVKEFESNNKEFNLINVIMENLKNSIETPQSLFDVIMFLSVLTQNGKFSNELLIFFR